MKTDRLLFDVGDPVKLVVPPHNGWHLAKRLRKYDGVIMRVVGFGYRCRGKGLSLRIKWYYRLSALPKDLIPPKHISTLIEHNGPLTEEVLVANRIFGKFKLNLT